MRVAGVCVPTPCSHEQGVSARQAKTKLRAHERTSGCTLKEGMLAQGPHGSYILSSPCTTAHVCSECAVP